ncbi:MAG: enoyl-CoA hydratase/isomerase family protein [Oscillospiraceae bacterium]|nr:enoyl-CoA hydratase/isomerase family protein [Oscillospiraceae bacterium]
MTEQPSVLASRQGDAGEILTLTFHNPSALNALTLDMQVQFLDQIRAAGEDKTIRVIILRGAGERAFSSGGSMDFLDALTTEEACEAMYQRGADIRNAIERLDKPILAAVSGWCIGGGFEIAMCCDMIYASDDARFGLTEVDIGLVPGWGGAIRLPRKVTVNKAKEMILLGRRISAQEAQIQGIVNDVFPKERLFEEVDAIARQLAAKPPLAVRGIKTIVSHGIVDGNVERAAEIEHKLSVYLMSTNDFHEAVDAFRAKRKPRFTGT